MTLLPAIVVLLGAVDPQPPVRAGAELAALGRPTPAELTAAARRALDDKEFARATVLAAVAAARAPGDGEAALVLGLARFRDGDAAAAVAPFSRAVAALPDSATARFDLASALYEAGRAAQAEARYAEAARLDAKVAALAEYDAALAALDAGSPARAAAHLGAAQAAARAADQPTVATRAAELAASLARTSNGEVSPELRALAHRGKEALAARRYDDAMAAYRRALDAALRQHVTAADRAELDYGLGHALYRKGDLDGAARAFAAAVALSPRDPDFHYMLGVVDFDLGADADAERLLDQALALGLGGDEAERARRIVAALRRAHGAGPSRFFAEARLAAGYDTEVPQSGVLVTAAHPASENTDAPFLAADLDLFWRPLGTARDGLSVEYRFSQLAYMSEILDPYSLQAHDLSLVGAWTPTPRLTLELGGGGYVLFAGVETFGPFEAGGSADTRATLREGHGLETRVRYQHIFKTALDPTYAYLGGNHDEAGLAEAWRDAETRVSFGYSFERESIGVERTALSQLVLPRGHIVYATPAVPNPTNPATGAYDPNAVYFIPWSFFGHEVSLALTRDLPRDFRGALTVRYEHRDYDGHSYIEPPSGATELDPRHRRDDRFGTDVAVRHPIGLGFDVELAYTLVVNRSTIDNTRASTPLDFDDKNYVKHVIQLDFAYAY